MRPPIAALALGLAGLLPFFGLAVLIVAGPEGWRATALSGFAAYAATILAFMGGCRWGFAAAGLGDGPKLAPLLLSTLPSLWAWATLWAAPALGPTGMSALFAIGFVALFAWDAASTRTGEAPAWWRALRLPLTAGVLASLALVGLGGS